MGMRSDGGTEVMVVTVEKAKLIQILKVNREKHVQEFKDACTVYKARVREEYAAFKTGIVEFLHEWDAATDWNKLPKFPEVHSRLPKPVSFAEQYDRALGMLELHTKTEMTLDMATYRKYVEDDWEWSSQAKMSNASYLVRN